MPGPFGLGPFGFSPWGGTGFPLPLFMIMTPTGPNTILVVFSDLPDPAAGVAGNWSLVSLAPYPIQITVTAAVYPYLGDPLQAMLTVSGMTAILYSGTVFQPLGDLTAYFLGIGGRDVLWTQKGPLVKAWGDDTPATVKDVHVYVGATQTEVTVAEVNPYTGRIRTAIPIPILPPGDPDARVTVDYRWIASPIMEMTGLNTEGLVLNKWDRNGRLPRNARFPMAVVLPHNTRPDPLQIGWRFMGFERAASALLNAPTTMALNQDPTVDAVPFFRRDQPSIRGSYEADQTPATSAWILFGIDSGSLNTSGEFVGTYTLEDANSGIYDSLVTDPITACARYLQPLDLVDMNLEGVTGQVTTRFEILEYQLDGVFTGIGFGTCGTRFSMVGAVEINGLEHVGFLTDLKRPDLEESWILGPQSVGTVTMPDRPDGQVNRIRFSTVEIPSNLKAGGKFQVLSGSQKGVYTIQSLVAHSNSTTLVTVSPVFPANPRLYGNKTPTVVFETPWTGTPSTYRMLRDPKTSNVSVWMSGSITMPSLSATEQRPIISLAIPSDNWDLNVADSPMFGDEQDGVWWGSVSFKATNKSRWSFIRWSAVPYTPTYRAARVSRNAFDPTDLTLTDGFNFSSKFGNSWGNGTNLVIQSSFSLEGSSGFRDPVGYFAEAIEPFLTRYANFDVSTKLTQDFGCPAANLIFSANDGERAAYFANLQYVEKVTSGSPYRRLVFLPSAAMTGFSLPIDQGWVAPISFPAATTITQLMGEAFQYTGDIYDPEILDPATPAGRLFQAQVDLSTMLASGDGMTSPYLGVDIAKDAHIRLRFKDAADAADRKILVTTLTGTVLHELTFDWSGSHLYSIASNGTGSIRVSVDPVRQIRTPIIQTSDCPGHIGDFLHDRYVFGTLANPAWKSITSWQVMEYSATAVAEPVGPDLRITQASEQVSLNSAIVAAPYEDPLDDGGRVMTARLAIESATLIADLTPVVFGGDVAWVSGHVRVRFGGAATPYVALTDINNVVVQTYSFDWTDGAHNTYQVRATSGGAVTLLINDQVQSPPLTVAQFPGRMSVWATFNDYCIFGALGAVGWESVVYWHSISSTYLPASDMLRTVGVYKASFNDNLWDIDNWELPRSDSSTALNSEMTGPVVMPVDWMRPQEYRLVRTPEWGLTVYIPSLGAPPWHVGVRQGWVNPKSEPSAGWINVEYDRLSPTPEGGLYGSFQFGSFAVSQTRWEWFRTRLYKPQDPNYIAPPSMVLNRANVITSGDLKKDQGLEIVAIQSIDKRRVTLKPTHIYAQSIYKIIDGSTVITRESWDFDRYAQLITLKDPIYQPTGGTAEFSAAHANLTVVFLPGRPVTDTYLLSQALEESTFLLNESTPPVPMNQYGKSVLVIKQDLAVVDATHLSLAIPGGNPAIRVIKIEDGAQTLVSEQEQTDFSPPVQPPRPADFTFDSGTQIVTLNTGRSFTTAALPPTSVPVTVWFAPMTVNLFEDDPTAVHIDPPGTFYRDLKFITVDNGGLTDLIASIGENTLSVGPSGWLAGVGGDIIYSPTGGGAPLGGVGPCAGLFDTGVTIGSPVGGSVFAFSGSIYSEQTPPVDSARVTFDLRWPDGTIITRWERLYNWPSQSLVSGTLLSASGGNAAMGGFLNDAALY